MRIHCNHGLGLDAVDSFTTMDVLRFYIRFGWLKKGEIWSNQARKCLPASIHHFFHHVLWIIGAISRFDFRSHLSYDGSTSHCLWNDSLHDKKLLWLLHDGSKILFHLSVSDAAPRFPWRKTV